MNKRLLSLIASFMIAGTTFAQDAEQNEGKHVFLLSGQSNMARFKPKKWFTPSISKALGADNVIVCFEAKGGQPISKWFKKWKNKKGETDSEAGQLYDALIEKMNTATNGSKIQSVTFIWMQGEADAKAKNGNVYLASLNGLKEQLEQDLKRTDINFIVGRLSDSGFFRRGSGKQVENPQWDMVRKAQVAFADASERAIWIDTDDLNGEKNELHYIKPDGYAKLGERYVAAAVKFLKGEGPTK
jgi:hypothetical protein